MAEAFKNFLHPALVAEAGLHLDRSARRSGLDFDAPRFVRLAQRGLHELELKARSLHIAAALQQTLPADFTQAADLLEGALAAPEAELSMAGLDDLAGLSTGLRGWICWPLGEFVAACGLDHPERALTFLHAMTQRFTAEFALRPFIVAHPELSWATLAGWCEDDSAQVRRLVSEGSRPRLPWGLRLRGLIDDPSPTLPLLKALQDDPSEYVRRSVANHLNDIAKDHPEQVCDWVQAHLPQASPERLALLRHASRSLIKAGHPRLLTLWGLGAAFEGEATLTLSAHHAHIGQSLGFTLSLLGQGARTQPLLIDYAVHHRKANGSSTAKVFKGWTLELPPGASRRLQKTHSLRVITTRRYHPGAHALSVQINGQEVARVGFELLEVEG